LAGPNFFLSMEQKESREKRSALQQGPGGISIFWANCTVLAGGGKWFFPVSEKIGDKRENCFHLFCRSETGQIS
jgi:hypothetical protein